MSQKSVAINHVESNTYTLDPNKVVKTVYIVVNPDGSDADIEYVKWNDVVSELMCTDIGEKMYRLYIEDLDGNFDEDEFECFCFDNIEEVATEMGYRFFRVTR